MPKSRARRKDVFVPPPAPAPKASKVSPPWLAPTMVVCFLLGLGWIVLYYLAGSGGVLAAMGAWNLVIGFALIAAGFVLASRWR